MSNNYQLTKSIHMRTYEKEWSSTKFVELSETEIAEIKLQNWKRGFLQGFGSAIAGLVLFQILKFVLTVF